MAAQESLDGVGSAHHTKSKMTADPGDILVPKPERIAVLRVGFEPSEQLNHALHGFLLPEYAERGRTIIFRSEASRSLGYSRSSNDGVSYAPHEAALLSVERRRLRSVSDPIGIVAAQSALSERGDLRVRLELQPTLRQRKLLGGYVLEGLLDEPGAPLWVSTYFHHTALRSQDELRKRAFMLEHNFAAYRHHRPHSLPPSALYVTKPHITERPGDLRVVP